MFPSKFEEIFHFIRKWLLWKPWLVNQNWIPNDFQLRIRAVTPRIQKTQLLFKLHKIRLIRNVHWKTAFHVPQNSNKPWYLNGNTSQREEKRWKQKINPSLHPYFEESQRSEQPYIYKKPSSSSRYHHQWFSFEF